MFRAMPASPLQRRQVLQAHGSLKVLKLSASSRAVIDTVQAQGLLGAHVALGLWGSEAMHLTWAPTPWHQEEIQIRWVSSKPHEHILQPGLLLSVPVTPCA